MSKDPFKDFGEKVVIEENVKDTKIDTNNKEVKEPKVKKDVSDLIIYKEYIELIYYTEMITKKYPNVEKTSLVAEIKKTTYSGMKCILCAYRVYDIKDKLRALSKLDIDLKMLKVLIRVSFKNEYISKNNYSAWSRKLNNVGSLLGGWINKCQKQ